MKKVSLETIAKSLNVSKTLVSMVINDKADKVGISKETQQRVLEKIEELNYRPNSFARSLRIGRSNTIGLIVADIANNFYSKMARHLEDLASNDNYNLVICSSDEKEEKEDRLIKALLDRHVDGIIVSSTLRRTDIYKTLKKEKVPFVLIDRSFPRFKANYVGVNNYQGAYDATDHLIKNGYTEIGYITLTPSHISTLKDRFSGYKDALRDNNIAYNGKIIREIPFEEIEKETTDILLDMTSFPNNSKALFIANNNLTIACLKAMNKLGLKTPEDIAIISFDDNEVFNFTRTPISAVAQPIKEICKESYDMLKHRINNKDLVETYEQKILKTNLVIRKSCRNN